MSEIIFSKEYCSNVFDGTHDSPKPCEIGVPLITSKNIVNGCLDFNGAYNISLEDYNKIQKRSAVSKWDIIFSMIGSVGEVYLEKNDNINYAIKNVGVLSCKDEYKAKWLYYYLKTPFAKSYIKYSLAGAVQKFLSLGKLRDFPIFQYDITKNKNLDFLSALDDKIELNNRINAELEAMAKTLYDYWFVQFDFPIVTSSGVEKPYKTSGGKMVYNETLKREIPEGWEVKNIKEVCEIIDCLHSKKPEYKFEDENFYLLQLENLLDNGLIDISKKYFVSEVDYKNWTNRITVKENDILFTNAGRVAQTTQLSKEIVSGIGRNITAVRPINISPTFCFLSINSYDVQKQIFNNIDQGAFFQSFNVKGIKLLNFIVPPKEVQVNFEKIVYNIRRKRELNLKQNQELSALRDWLLPMLMNGQVKVE